MGRKNSAIPRAKVSLALPADDAENLKLLAEISGVNISDIVAGLVKITIKENADAIAQYKQKKQALSTFAAKFKVNLSPLAQGSNNNTLSVKNPAADEGQKKTT